MPRKQKTGTSKPVLSVDSKEKKPTLPKKSSSKKPVEVKPVEVKPVEVKPVEVKPDEVKPDEVKPVEVVPQLTLDFAEFLGKLQQMTQMISTLRTEFKVLEKKANRELKIAQKANEKRKRKQGNRSPSGFVKPTKISSHLATFLNKPSDVMMARTDVTREINSYIRANNLQDKANGRKINADTKLSKLLNLKSGDELTYFNLQKYMSPHFAKSGAPPKA